MTAQDYPATRPEDLKARARYAIEHGSADQLHRELLAALEAAEQNIRDLNDTIVAIGDFVDSNPGSDADAILEILAGAT